MTEDHREGLPPPVTHASGSSRDVVTSDAGAQYYQHNNMQYDELERRLQTRSSTDPEVQIFLRDYARFKKQRAVKCFASIVGYDLFQPQFTFQSPFMPQVPYAQRKGNGSLEGKTSFSDLLRFLRPALNAGATDCVRFFFLSSDASDDIQSEMYPLSAKIFATVKQLHRKYTAPKLAILYLIDQQWNLSTTTMKGCIGALRREKKRWSLQRPSESIVRAPFKIKSRDEMTLELAWLASVPKYHGQISTYIWQPDVESPEPIHARLSIQGVDERGCCNVLLVLTSLDHSNRLPSEYHWQRRHLLPGYSSKSSNVESEILLVIYNVYLMLTRDTTTFIESAVAQINDFKYSGRRRPSNSMIHHLFHLEDCFRESLSGLEHASSLMQEISRSIACDHAQVDAVLRSWPTSALEDLDYLQKELEQTREFLGDTREMINEQLTLRNGQRTSLLTLLAAIYIPFSFMSSLFGMNLSNPIWGPSISNSTSSGSLPKFIPNTTSSTGLSQDQTTAIVAAISSSGPYLWSFKLYWVIIGPITLATILLPLIAGPLFRSTLKAFHRNRIYSRPLLALLCLGALVAMDEFTPPIFYTYVFSISFGSAAVYTLARASYSGEDQVIWCGYSVIFAASFTMDNLIGSLANVGICGYLSLVYLIFVWLGPELKDLAGRRLPQVLHTVTGHSPEAQRRLLGKFRALKSNQRGRKRMAIMTYFILTLPLYLLMPFYGVLPFFSIPFGVLAVNRAIRSMRTRRYLAYWALYSVIFGLSLSIDSWSLVNFFGSNNVLPNNYDNDALPVFGFTCFLPMTYLFSAWIYLDHKPFFYKQLQRLTRLLS